MKGYGMNINIGKTKVMKDNNLEVMKVKTKKENKSSGDWRSFGKGSL